MMKPMKVLSAEGNKGVPLDPALGDLLQGLLKLDSRHRLSARDALANPYFAPRPEAAEERVRKYPKGSIGAVVVLSRVVHFCECAQW